MRLPSVLPFIYALPMLFAPSASAGPASRQSVVKLTATADAIVAGPADVTEANGTVSAMIQVERVLKGSPTPGSAVALVWTPPPSRMPWGKGRSLREHGLFFLRQNAGGSWAILPATVGSARWQDVYIPTPASVPQSLRDVASAGLPPGASVLENVLMEMVITTEAGAPMPFDLVEIFRESRSPVLVAAFARFLSKQDPTLRSIGLRGSISSGDPSALLAVQQNYAALSSARGWLPLLQEIKWYYLNTGPQAIQVLGQIATDSSVAVDLRIAVAGALARMHTRQSLPYLAELLADQNSTLRAMAVGGLSSFANNVPIGSHQPAPGPWPYRTDQTIAHSAFDERAIEQKDSYYVGFWQSWWQQNQSTLAQPGQ